ncbi:IS66 family transposase, partial [Vibrio anguillarum]|nr:IS66 family transposase [Vibrio anguillarum]
MTSSINYLAEIEQLRAQLAEKEAQLQSQSARINVLEEVVRHLKIKRFMPSSEKTNADQFLLFDEAELCTDPQVEQHEKDNQDQSKSSASTRKPRGRKPLSSDLPREQIFLYLTDEQKAGAKSTFFAKVKEELDIVPAKVRVLEYMQEKAVFNNEDGQSIVAAELPKHPLPGSLG